MLLTVHYELTVPLFARDSFVPFGNESVHRS